MVEKSFEKRGKQIIKTREFYNSQKVIVSSKYISNVKGVLHDISDSTLYVGKSDCIRINDIKEIKRFHTHELVITGAGMIIVGIAFTVFIAKYGNIGQTLGGIGTVFLGGCLAITSSIVQAATWKRYSLKNGWKVKSISKPVIKL